MKKYELLISDTYKIFAPLDKHGCSDVLDFLFQEDDLNDAEQKERRQLLSRLQRLAKGPEYRLHTDICHLIDENNQIYQVRSSQYRMLWFYDKGAIIICTNVFPKKKNGPPPRKDMQRARDRQAEYFEAKRANQLKFIDEDDEE